MFQFNSEDKSWNNLVIADAVRASMSLPVIYPPHILNFQEASARVPDGSYGTFMDGGLSGILFNLPIEAFDRKKYITKVSSELEGNFIVTNKKTLAFSLYTPGKNLSQLNTHVTCFLAAYSEWSKCKREAAKIYKKTKIYLFCRRLSFFYIIFWEYFPLASYHIENAV